MVKRHLYLAVCVYLTTVAALAQTSYVFQLPGATSTAPTQVLGDGDNDFSRYVTAGNAPNATSAVVATPGGSKLYFLAPGGVFSATASPATHALAAITPVAGIAGAPSAKSDTLTITQDGKYLLVITDQFYIVSTSTNTLAVGANTGVPQQATPVSVAVSHDAKTAWILSSSSGGSTVTALNLTTMTTAGSFSLPSEGSSMVLSPRSLLYVAATGSAVYEIDPVTLTLTNSGQVVVPNGTPGPLQFTPDGNTAYFLNRGSCSNCPPIFKLNAPGHTISGWLPTDGSTFPALDQVLLAGNSRVFALSPAPTQECPACRKLWDVTPTPLGLTPSVLGSLPTGNVLAATVSNERPSARYLYLFISDHSFYRVNLAVSGIDQSSSLDPAKGTILSFVPIPAQTGATSLFPINPTQGVNPSATTVLIGQALDPVGRPVFGLPVGFSSSSCVGITIGTPSTVTASEGWAQTTVTAPSAPGSCTVTLTAGSLSTDFQLVVGGGSNTGSPQISIFSGDGQLLRQNEPTLETQQPLKVRVTDGAGNPLANVHVIFARTEGRGSVSTPETDTDLGGFASTDYTTESLPFGVGFELNKITATSTFGSVEFYETTQNGFPTDVHQTNTAILTPSDQHLTIPQGGFIAAGITASTVSGSTAGPIPNVGLRLADLPPNISQMSPIASCVGLSRGDNNGISRCDVQAACQPGVSLPQDFAAIVQVGEFKSYFLNITVTKGAPSLLTLVSGNNQTGVPGDSFTLSARVTDGCSQAAGNFSGLTWTVQGAGTLSQQQTTSDSNGNVSARVTLGQTAGTLRVQLSGPNLNPVVFTLTIQIPVSGITLVSGGGQSATVGQPFTNPVVFVARAPGGVPAPAGLVVNFTVSGSATVNPGSATTNAQGLVQTNVTAGATPSNIVITATYSSFSATASLSSHAAGPSITTTSFTNAASGAVGLTPCGLVTVSGTGIAPTLQGVVSGVSFFGPLSYSLVGLSMTANNIPVPIHSIANDQYGQRANFQAPCELTPGTATVVVTVNGVSTTVSGVPVLAVQPGIFAYAGSNNKIYGTVISAADGSLVTLSNPARQGGKYFLYATGLGVVTPVAGTNAVGTGSQDVNLPIVVGVADRGVPVLFARYLAGAVGAYLVEFQLPADAPTGVDQSLALAALVDNGITYKFGNPVFLPAVAGAP